MPSSVVSDTASKQADAEQQLEGIPDVDKEFGGHEARKQLEKKLLRKLDMRVSILIVIYILNYVSVASLLHLVTHLNLVSHT